MPSKCLIQNCNIYPCFNFENNNSGMYCNSHKLEGMVNIKDKRCEFQDCKTRACFNYENCKNPIYCNTHKLEKMENVKNKKCLFNGCKITTLYNYEGKKKAIYCNLHKLEGMINVITKKCEYTKCNTKANFNFEGQKQGIYCHVHKHKGMIDVKNNKCIFEGCNTLSNYNFEGIKKGIYCNIHKKEGMIDVKNKRCKTDWCSAIVLKKNNYEGYCMYCYVHLFPDKPTSRNYKTKEKSVVEFIKVQFSNIDIKTDKRIINGCSKRRPDVLIDLEYQVVIIEIDEYKHNDYTCSCENKRIMELSQDVGHRPIVMIRFNPDDYELNGVKIKSCWELNKNGLCTVKKSKKQEWNMRLNQLKETIEYWLDENNATNKIIETIHLFYGN